MDENDLLKQKRIVRHDTTQSAVPKNIDPVRDRIARRAALEFKNGMYANLGKIEKKFNP